MGQWGVEVGNCRCVWQNVFRKAWSRVMGLTTNLLEEYSSLVGWDVFSLKYGQLTLR